MQVMLSLKDSRHGLSSIYSLFLHFEKSATFGTVGYSKVFYGNTQWNFSLCWSAWTFFSFSSSFLHAVTLLSASMLATKGGWRLQAMRSWRIQQAQTNSAFFKFTALFAWLRMSFVWLWMSPQESKGVYKLVPVASQIFLLTVAQLFRLSLTSRSQVTLSMVTLFLISQWLRHLFRWANASASDYYIISSPLLQLYMLQPDQLLHSGCEEEREALFLFFDWRSSVTAPIEDCTSLYVFMERFNGQSSLRVYHSNTATFRWCGAEASRADEVGQLACPPEFVSLSLSNNHACIFLSQVFMPAFSSLGFSLPVRLLILLKMMLCSTALSRLSATEHWRKQHGEGWTVCHDLIHFCSGRRNTLLVFSLGRICSLFKQVWKKLCTLQVFLMLQLYLPLLENLFDSESWQTRAHRYGLCPHSGYVTLQNLFRSFEHGFWWDRILI